MSRISSSGREPYSKFKCYLGEKNISYDDLGSLIGISKSGIAHRINGNGSDFTVEEIRVICLHYGISADDFFITKKVS